MTCSLSRWVSALPDGGDDPEAAARREQMIRLAAAAVRSLEGPKQRAVIQMRYTEGATYAEIGVRLTISAPAAYAIHERAVENMRKWLANRGITSASF